MNSRLRGQGCKKFTTPLTVALWLLVPVAAWAIEQLKFKPGFNFFSPQQDIQVGREASAQADKQFPLVSDPAVVNYVNDLGRRMARFAPINSDYPWTFKVVNS